jgi:hypothetical protein
MLNNIPPVAVRLSFDDGFDRTHFNTGTTVGTLIRIDGRNLIPFCNRAFGALIDTGTAVDAFIGNFVSHNSLL